MSRRKKSARIKVDIPLMPHLKKFLYWYENIVDEETGQIDYNIPYAVDRQHSLCAYILKLMLQGKAAIPPYKEGPISSVNDIHDLIHVELSLQHFHDGRLFLTKQNILNFNKVVQGVMNDVMVNYILVHHAYMPNGEKFEEKKVILGFMELIGASIEEVNWDTLKKASYRVRDYRGLPIFGASRKKTTNSEIQEIPSVFSQKKERKNPFLFPKLSLAV